MKHSGQILPASFYYRNTATVAKDLLGKILRVRESRIWRSGVITETEAYVKNDPANHAFHGQTKRNQSMFKGPSRAYVYSIHRVCCINAVTRPGEAVLIRSIQPLKNITLRSDGPGRLCRALMITKSEHDGKSLLGPEIQIIHGNHRPFKASASRRIGVTKAKDKMLRFTVSL
jgi:DNA-3-methyladenine glycosylase